MILLPFVFIALMDVSMPQIGSGGDRSCTTTLAQGTDKLPGGVEHLPMPQSQTVAPSMSAPAPMPDMRSAPAAMPPPTSSDRAIPEPESLPDTSAEKKPTKKSKKAAPNAKRLRPAPGTGGDDRIPGGVERSPDTGQ